MHISVLPKETLQHWIANPEGLYADLTTGYAGHSLSALEAYPKLKLICFDWDLESLNLARERLAPHASRVRLVHQNFSHVARELQKLSVTQVDGFLFDLGPSSFQILHAGRGLTYQKEEPLDMRMSKEHIPYPAQWLVERLNASEWARILVELAEIPMPRARRLGQALESLRLQGKLNSTKDLSEAVERLFHHRAVTAQVFQAIRIAVNHEFENLEQMMEGIWKFLAPGGRVVAISFHSLEDRLVKKAFTHRVQSGQAVWVVKKPVMASEEEIHVNPKSRSAKLRVLERTR